jgi:hypothetical protein
VSTALGLIAFAGYALAIVALAAGITWVVVRVTPGQKPGSPPRS